MPVADHAEHVSGDDAGEGRAVWRPRSHFSFVQLLQPQGAEKERVACHPHGKNLIGESHRMQRVVLVRTNIPDDNVVDPVMRTRRVLETA
jgi:hypothetical protein